MVNTNSLRLTLAKENIQETMVNTKENIQENNGEY